MVDETTDVSNSEQATLIVRHVSEDFVVSEDLFTHCYGHTLNLAASDTLKQCKLMKDALDTTHEITKLIKYSPRREGIFRSLKDTLPSSSTPGVRVLCPTRWTVRADSLLSIVTNYEALQSTWDEAVTIVNPLGPII